MNWPTSGENLGNVAKAAQKFVQHERLARAQKFATDWLLPPRVKDSLVSRLLGPGLMNTEIPTGLTAVAVMRWRVDGGVNLAGLDKIRYHTGVAFTEEQHHFVRFLREGEREHFAASSRFIVQRRFFKPTFSRTATHHAQQQLFLGSGSLGFFPTKSTQPEEKAACRFRMGPSHGGLYRLKNADLKLNA